MVKSFIYQQVENSFTQPNASISEKNVGWALDVTKGASGDLLEMYCGNGQFLNSLSSTF